MGIRRLFPAVLLVCAVSLVGGSALGAPEVETSQLFAEVPPRHWSYGAMRTLSTSGLVTEPPDGFGAGLTVTRLEMALEVGEAMDRLRAAAPDAGPASLPMLVARYNRTASQPLGTEQMRLLEDLAREFSPELGVLGYSVIPSPQSFRLENPPAIFPTPELDAVWLGLGDAAALTWSPSASLIGGLPVPGETTDRAAEDGRGAGGQGLSLGARIRLLPAVRLEGEVEPLGERPGYRIGAGVDLGDVYITGGYDVPSTAGPAAAAAPNEASGPEPGRTRWGLRWTSGDAQLTAAYEYVGLDQLRILGDSDLPSRFELGVGVAVEGGTIRVGWSREALAIPVQGAPLATGEVEGSSDEDGDASLASEGEPEGTETAPARQVNTVLRVTYDLSSIASLTLGYRLIDFTGEGGEAYRNGEKAAMAEFTLRF